jgi:hypothetical protein
LKDKGMPVQWILNMENSEIYTMEIWFGKFIIEFESFEFNSSKLWKLFRQIWVNFKFNCQYRLLNLINLEVFE